MSDLLTNLGGLPTDPAKRSLAENLGGIPTDPAKRSLAENLGLTPNNASTVVDKGKVPVQQNTKESDVQLAEPKVEYNQNSKFPLLRYPKFDIYEDTDYLKIDVMRYVPLGFTPGKDVLTNGLRKSKDQYKGKDPLGSILLPIPQSISDTNSTGWGQDSINAGAAYAMGVTNDVITGDNFFGGIMGAIKQAGVDIGNLAQDGSTREAVNAGFGAAAANLFGGNTSFEGVLARSSGQILNPNTELLFNGIKLRSFNFTFALAPRNKDEATDIKQIIRILKTNMAPTTNSGGSKVTGLFLKSPNVFQLTYMKGAKEHPHLNKFIIAALTNMQVNYTASGTYATYDDGMPVYMTMTLSFQELSPIYAENQDKSGGMGF